MHFQVLTTDKFVDPTSVYFNIGLFFREAKENVALDSLHVIVRWYDAKSLEHSKMYIIDDEKAVFGSANLTEPGMWENYETICVSQTDVELRDIKEAFNNAWQEAASPFQRRYLAFRC